MKTTGGRHRARRGAVIGAVAALVATALMSVAPAGAADPTKPPADRHSTVAGELLLRFEPTAGADEKATARDRLGLTPVRTLPVGGWELVRTGDRTTPAADQARRVERDRAVRQAQPNYLYHPTQVIPNDTEFEDLWGLHNSGQTGGTDDADIDAPEAWVSAPDQSALVVAVTDTGVWAEHPDLAANMWVNPGEIAGNGIDDDGNSFVDDVHGWDFHHDDASVFDEDDPDDHGTHVAGTIAAVAGNASGVAGVSNAKIMALKFLGPAGGTTADAIDAVNYAVTNGADVINASWGGGPFDGGLRDAIAAADTAGVLFVAAAGNAATDTDLEPHYPSSYDLPNVVSVAATTHDDGLASFSNFGATSVDLGAPGESILSTVPQFAKAVLSGAGTAYHAAYHSFGLEGVTASADREALLGAALAWAGASPGDAILVVDDDEGASYQTTYTSTLTALGYTTNITTFTVGTGGACGGNDGPDSATMSGNAVIWLTGADFGCWSGPGSATPDGDSTLTATDQSELTTHLDGGGALLLFGQDIGYDLTDDRTASNTFLSSKLRTGYVADLDLNFRLLGQDGTAYAALSTIELTAGLGAGQTFSSALVPLAGAVAGLRGAPTTWFSGTSMAAPHVSGAAAVLHAAVPGFTHLEVKALLLDGGDAIASLDGKTVTGRRLNLNTSLSMAPSVPGPPTSVDASAANASATVSWTAPADDGGSAVDEYKITIYKGTTVVGTTTAAGTATSKTVSGLTNGTTYAFTVAAKNVAGFGTASEKSNTVTPRTVPGAPTSVSATAADTSASVKWKPPASDGGAAITSYTVTAHTAGSPVKSVKVSGSTTSVTVSSLTAGAAYTFTVKATNAEGTGPSSSHSNQVDIPLPRSGYWMLGSPGNVHAFGDAANLGSASLPAAAEDIEPSPSGNGYWVVDALGYVAAFGDAPHYGGLNGALQPGESVTALSATPAGTGYWLFTNLGRVAAFGAAPHLGDMAGVALNGPVLDSVATPSGKGYYMVGSDGGIFAFGDAAFYGSMGGIPLNAPVQSLVPDGDGVGYWLVASDGGIFAFAAAFYGSMGATPLNQPITGMVAAGSAGYLMVGSDGGIFAFGSAPFHGSLGANPPPYPIVSVAVLRD